MIAGHDWGGLLVWTMARQYPRAHRGRDRSQHARPAPPACHRRSQFLRALFADKPFYLVQFQDRGVAEWVFTWGGRPHDDFVDVMFRGPATVNHDAFPREVLDVYKHAFRGAGALTPPLEYYRNMDRNWHLTEAIADRTIDVPCLMISAAGDLVLRPEMTIGHGGARARTSSGC